MTKSICFFTSTRADYGLLRSPIRRVLEDGRYRLQVIVSGAHLAPSAGFTLSDLEADGIPVDAKIAILMDGLDENAVCTAMGLGVMRYGEVLSRLKPDVVVVLGDRYETLAFASAAAVHRIPLAHINGGEATYGAVDEMFRHSITKMSQLHFASCEEYRRRIIQLGEHPDMVWNVGALGVENIHSLTLPNEAVIRKKLDLGASQPYILCTIHPETLGGVLVENLSAAMLEGLAAFPEYAVIFTGANADAGGTTLNGILQNYVMKHGGSYRFSMSLGLVNYLAAAKYAACVAGNSSSGILEVPSLATPVVDVGDRQAGRLRSQGVLHCEAKAADIKKTLGLALSEDFANVVRSAQNPYDKPGTTKAICDILFEQVSTVNVMKRFHDLSSAH